jgi:hypothetical protein
MAVGQVVLAGVWDVPALQAAEDRLEARAVDAGRVRAALLRDVLVVHGQYSAAGVALSSQAQVALLLRCSELRAGRLLHDALGLAELPEALAARPAATPSTTWPGRWVRRARATSGRAAGGTTGSSRRAGARPAPPTASAGRR